MTLEEAISQTITREQIKGSFDSVPQAMRDRINLAFAHFYFRTGSKKPDGTLRNHDASQGEVIITPHEMRDLLAYLLKPTAP